MPVDLRISTRANLRLAFEGMFHDKSKVTDDLVELAYALHLERGDGYTIRSVLQTFGVAAEKLDGKLAALHMPTLLLWGANDALTPLSMARAWQRNISGSQLHIIERCGHLPPLEQPAEFSAAVNAFLEDATVSI